MIDRHDIQLRRVSAYPVVRSTSLRWADVDTYGHVNNAVTYLLMDTAVNGWMIESTGKDIRHDLSGFAVVAQTGCHYLREMRFGDSPSVGIRATSIGRTSVTYELGIFIDDGAPAAVGGYVHVYVSHDDRRPVAIPAEVRVALEVITNA
jgi:acyl-CoA thioester hydrolase